MFEMIDILYLLTGFLELWHIIRLYNEKNCNGKTLENFSFCNFYSEI